MQNAGDSAVAAISMRMLVAADARERRQLQAQLVGLRLVVMPPLITVGVLFALLLYDAPRSETTLVICLSTLVAAIAAALIMPLNLEMRAGRASLVDFVRQIVVALGLLLGVAVSAPLLGYAVVYLIAATVGLVVAVLLIEPEWRKIQLPDRETLKVVSKQASWLALALTVNSLFLKVLTVIASLATTKTETGLFGAATRVTEVVAALSLMVVSVAYPLLSRAADDRDWPRFTKRRAPDRRGRAAARRRRGRRPDRRREAADGDLRGAGLRRCGTRSAVPSNRAHVRRDGRRRWCGRSSHSTPSARSC